MIRSLYFRTTVLCLLATTLSFAENIRKVTPGLIREAEKAVDLRSKTTEEGILRYEQKQTEAKLLKKENQNDDQLKVQFANNFVRLKELENSEVEFRKSLSKIAEYSHQEVSDLLTETVTRRDDCLKNIKDLPLEKVRECASLDNFVTDLQFILLAKTKARFQEIVDESKKHH
jgi:hypothetical protein